MKSGNSASAPSAGGNSLAITERQKPAPSCVASLFQMLAKRKLFSSSSKKTKLLPPPVRTQKFSPGRPPAGGEKTPAAKMRTLLLDSPYDPNEVTSRLPPPGQDNRRSEMCTPGVVARLMGLSSMPATSHQKAAKTMDASELGGHRNECSYGSIDNSHQKQQKPGQLRDGRHDNGSQFNEDVQPLWSRRHAHKVASPIKSPRSISRRNKTRLIEAAVKVLEPGLQSRYRHQARRHARLEYTCNNSGVPSGAEAMHNFSDQFSREMCDVDASRLVQKLAIHLIMQMVTAFLGACSRLQDGAHLFEPAFQDSNLIHPGEVAATVELLLTTVRRSTQRSSKAPFKAFLVQTFESALTTLTTSSKKNGFNTGVVKGTEGRSPLGNLAFNSVMECLDSMFTQFCDSGYRSFSRLTLICPEERLAAEVNKEIARCSGMAGKALDDLIASDVQHAAVETSTSSLHEAFQIGVQIERDLLQELVAEIGVDVLKRL
ncbi:hypothetical protein E2562_022111 [Oryza meyeriana var. granulata]|uniref:DUF3741 domain-containing protein n=1 Tax=Oryza meyeriana var. granulata TaxID=110450 RepID=A0A6G1ENT3_9ORYZ|nr:hypothetical protein E2562_022111 [Oryza meyeriana var. granulata]